MIGTERGRGTRDVFFFIVVILWSIQVGREVGTYLRGKIFRKEKR
jgi:hypothetical protein